MAAATSRSSSGGKGGIAQARPWRALVPALVALALLPACAHYPVGNPQATVAIGPGGLPSTVALLPEPDWPVVDVALDGVPGYRFLVDSGATPAALFVHDRTRALAAKASGRVPVRGAGGGSHAEAGLLPGVDVTIGVVTLRNMTLLTIDAAAIPRLGDPDAFDLDGILGYDLLSRYAVRVDMRARALTILAPDTPPAPGTAIVPLELRGRSAYVTLPLSVVAGGAPEPANLHLDTGFVGHLQLVTGDDTPFRLPAAAWPTLGAGIQGETRDRLAAVARVEIGGGAIDSVPTIFSVADLASGRHGRLGSSLLARFAYTIDLPAERLLLEPRADSFGTPSQGFVGLSGAPAAGSALVRHVQPGSPAARAGFVAGDRLVSIDGVATAGLSRRELAEKLQVDAGRRLELCRRDGARVDCLAVVAGDLARPPGGQTPF